MFKKVLIGAIVSGLILGTSLYPVQSNAQGGKIDTSVVDDEIEDVEKLYRETGGSEYSPEAYNYWNSVEWDITDVNDGIDYSDNRTMIDGDSASRVEETRGGAWVKVNGKYKYRKADGTYATNGWLKINGKWYYFDSEGYRVSGWINDGGTWYYCNSSGVMQTGWITVSGKSYFMNPSGAMQKGWVNPSGTWYYLSESTGEWIDNDGTHLASQALLHQGVPYVWGGTNLVTGVDCSGFVQSIHSLCGFSIPRTADNQYYGRTSTQSWSSLKPGDLIFFGTSTSNITHVGMYVGKVGPGTNQMIHASSSAGQVVVSNLNSNVVAYGSYWR